MWCINLVRTPANKTCLQPCRHIKPKSNQQWEGKWLKRTVDSQEASAWLTQLLRKRDPSMERVTTHSLKHTPLGWLSKYDIYGETQTLLSHHSTGALSTLAYSRDALSGPLRQFERLLKQIRLGAFTPDSTRSGYWTGGNSQGPESTIGSWEDVTATSNFSTSALPVLQTGKAASFQPEAPPFGEPSVLTGEGIADESLPPATDEDSPSGAPVNDSQPLLSRIRLNFSVPTLTVLRPNWQRESVKLCCCKRRITSGPPLFRLTSPTGAPRTAIRGMMRLAQQTYSFRTVLWRFRTSNPRCYTFAEKVGPP